MRRRKLSLSSLESRDCPATLDLTGYASAVNVTLVASGAGGFSGTLSGGASGAFSGVDSILGNGGFLKGRHASSTWTITSPFAGAYADAAASLTFTDFATLTGGFLPDAFVSAGDVIFSGTISGGSGADRIDYGSNGAGRTFTVNALNAGDVDGNPFTSVERLTGGSGDDTFRFATNGAALTSTLTAGGGSDLLDYTGRTSGVRVNLLAGTAGGTGGVVGIEDVTGGDGPDVLTGDDSANALDGGQGEDVIVGNGGADALFGSAGRDVLIGGEGADDLQGGDADDLLLGGMTAHDVDQGALDAVRSEWTRLDADYDDRIAHLMGTLGGGLNGGNVLASSTVADDGEADLLAGQGGQDWFVVAAGDAVADQAGDETGSTF